MRLLKEETSSFSVSHLSKKMAHPEGFLKREEICMGNLEAKIKGKGVTKTDAKKWMYWWRAWVGCNDQLFAGIILFCIKRVINCMCSGYIQLLKKACLLASSPLLCWLVTMFLFFSVLWSALLCSGNSSLPHP